MSLAVRLHPSGLTTRVQTVPSHRDWVLRSEHKLLVPGWLDRPGYVFVLGPTSRVAVARFALRFGDEAAAVKWARDHGLTVVLRPEPLRGSAVAAVAAAEENSG